MKKIFILALFALGCAFGSETSLQPSRFFIYDLDQVPFVKVKVLNLYILEDRDFEGLPDRVLKELEADMKADTEVTIRFLELPPESPYSKRELSILSIHRKGALIYDASICPVHSIQMQLEDRKISYGLLAGPGRKFYEMQAKLFPYADRVVSGGCVVTSDSRKTLPLFICSRCNGAKHEYKEKG